MSIDHILNKLQTRTSTPERAKELGQLGYMQWLAGLPVNADYVSSAIYAYDMSEPIMHTDPAVAAFCELLVASIENPLTPLDLSLPKPRRRGGAKERRMSL